MKRPKYIQADGYQMYYKKAGDKLGMVIQSQVM